MAIITYPHATVARQLLQYDPDTGAFVWKKRPLSMFSDGAQSARHNCSIWNGRFSGKSAGCVGKDGYHKIRIHDRLYLAHILAWIYVYGEAPTTDLDHINIDPSDNRIANLRIATRSQNMGNTNAHSDSLTGRKGAYFRRERNKWQARIYFNGKQHNLGSFDTGEDASAVYKAAALKMFGRFARHK